MMSTLRRQFRLTTGLLLLLQAGAAGLATASWRQVLASAETETAIAASTAEIDMLSEIAREQYVHAAHTFIEGGPGHLGHMAHTQAAVDAQIARVRALPLRADEAKLLDAAVEAIEDGRNQFRLVVVPLAEAGRLDRPTAGRLHDDAEALASVVTTRINDLGASLAADAAAVRQEAANAAFWAWVATAVLMVGACGLAFALTNRLARRVLDPLSGLTVAAKAFGDGESVPVPIPKDQELHDLALAFERMIAAVKASEERRVRSERLAALGEMSGAVAHELLNPLTVILGHEAMRSPDLAAVRDEAEHALRVVRGLLGFARPGEEPATLLDLSGAVRTAVDRILPMAIERDVAINANIPDGVRAVVSTSALRQILDNLVRNAIEATPSGGTVEVTVSDASIEVADRGPGIPAAIRSRLYEPFATGRPNGTGLGLAIAQRIVRAQGGSLSHEDRPGGGTVARWRLGG